MYIYLHALFMFSQHITLKEQTILMDDHETFKTLSELFTCVTIETLIMICHDSWDENVMTNIKLFTYLLWTIALHFESPNYNVIRSAVYKQDVARSEYCKITSFNHDLESISSNDQDKSIKV